MPVENMEHTKKKLPVIANSAVLEKVTKGRAGIRWDNVVDKIWKETNTHREEKLSTYKFGGYKTEIKEILI